MSLNSCPQWVFGNVGAEGYYRAGYSADDARKVANSGALKPGEQMDLISDEWAQVAVAHASIGDYLDVIQPFVHSQVPNVLETFGDRLGQIRDYLTTAGDRTTFENWIRTTFRPVLEQVGWKAAPNEPVSRADVRRTVLSGLAFTGRDPQVLQQARQMADQYVQDPTSVDPNLSGWAVSAAALTGDTALYDKYMSALKTAKAPNIYYTFFYALSTFRDPTLVQRTLEFALSPEVRTQDAPGLIASELQNAEGRDVAWDFIRQHWDDVQKKLPPFGGMIGIVGSTSAFCDVAHRDEVQQFFSEHKVEGAERTLRRALDRINTCIDLRSQQESRLAAWLNRHGSGGGAPAAR
jgi:aminopeptidase N/puromycin-sensitive aminopeptidase